MDIVVTIPKKEAANNLRERREQLHNPSLRGFRVFKNLPIKTKVGDRIYFVYDGKVRHSKIIDEIVEEKDEVQCEVTGRVCGGNNFIFFKDERNEEHLEIEVVGFQGFRYKWW